MAIKNINNIQSNIDYLTSNIDVNYLIQALTNLGQREGIKGSSIVYNYFTPEDLGEIGTDYIVMSNNNGILNYGNIGNNDKNWKSIIAFNDAIQTITNINNKIINNISAYRSNVLNIKNDKLYHFSCGEVLGSNKNELIYTVYDLKENIIEYAIRSFYLYNDGVSNYYCMLEIEKNQNSGVISKSGTHRINYILTLYLFNSSSFNNISSSKNLFEECYYVNDHLTDNINIKDIKDNIYNFKKTQLYILFKNYEVKDSQFSVDNLWYNTDENSGFVFEETNISPLVENNYEIIKFELNKELGLYTRVESFLTNDILYLYPKLLQLYNEDILNSQSNKYRFILESIFNYIYESLDEAERNSFKLYIPKGYKFRYQCDSKDKSKIYNSNNNFILLDNKDINSFDKLTNIYGYCGETSDSKIINIYYEIEYNDVYNDYIIGVNVEQLYTLPYINYKNNWCLYGGDTDISAVGRDAGNPNIIIMHNTINNGKIEYNILSGIFNNQLLKYDIVTGNFPFFVNDYLPGNNDKLIKTAKYALPKIDKSNVDFLTYAIIILVTDISCVNNIDPNTEDYSNIKYLTSIWHIDTTDYAQMQNGYTQFTFIPYSDYNVAFNFNKLFNISAFIPDAIDDEIIKRLKINGKFINNFKLTNDNLDIFSDRFILEYLDANDVRNNNGSVHYSYVQNDITYYISTYSIPDIYNNSNVALKFNSEIYGNDNGDNKINNSYLMSYTTVSATNYLYPKLKNSHVSVNNTTTVSSLQNMLINANDIYSDIYITNGESAASVFSLDEGMYQNEAVLTTAEQIISYNIIYGDANSNNNNKDYYNEYTFNNNVPTLNLSSVFMQDVNTLNRVNIISLANNGQMYNGYIGTRFTDDNKHQLVIGTSSRNINLNNTYLVSVDNSGKFNEYTELHLEFDRIKVGNDKVDLLAKIKELEEKIHVLESHTGVSTIYPTQTTAPAQTTSTTKTPSTTQTSFTQ